jgi:hypothetical protein
MEAAIWKKRTKGGELVPTVLPRTIGDTYLEMLDEWKVPHLTGTVETPTLYKSGEGALGYPPQWTPLRTHDIGWFHRERPCPCGL